MNSSLTARLGDLVEILSGFAFDSTNFSDEGDVALIRIRDVLRGQSSTFFRGEYDPKYLINAGEILIGMDGEFNRARWRSAPALLNQRVCRISSSGPRLSDEYLFHFLPAALKSIEDATSFVTVKHLSAKQIREIEIPLPPIQEQRRIAAILDQAQTLRTRRRTALAQLDALTQSLFLDMFGDPSRQHWQLASIADIVDEENGSIRTGPFGSQLLHSEFVNDGVAVLGIDNAVANEFRWGERRYVSHQKYQELKRYTVKPGDVLITIMGTCGRCAVVPDDIPLAINTKHLCCISVDKQRMKPAFLHAFFLLHPMARKYLEQTAKGAIMSGLNMGIIKAMPIPVPPLALQKIFATRIRTIEALKANHRAALAELDALFASLQQRAFSGELTQSTSPVQVLHTKAHDFSELCKLDADKGLEALIYVARRMPEHHFYKSLKALYFADKHQLEHQGRLIYGETHCALPMGPVPQAAYDAAKVLNGELLVSAFDDEALRASLRRADKELIPLRDANSVKLSAAERASLDWAISYVAPMSFDQVKTVSHDSAYERTPRNQPILLEHMIEMLPEAAKRRFFD